MAATYFEWWRGARRFGPVLTVQGRELRDGCVRPMEMKTDSRRAAFEAVASEVYEPLQRYLRRRCQPDDVDDDFNDVLLVLWRRIDDLPGGNPLPWCYGIARRCLANHRRGDGRRLRLVRHMRSAASTEPEGLWVNEADVELHEALDQLSDLDREVIRLWAWERLEPREIAEVLDSTSNAISVRLNRARRQLHDQLARKDRVVAGHKRSERHSEVKP